VEGRRNVLGGNAGAGSGVPKPGIEEGDAEGGNLKAETYVAGDVGEDLYENADEDDAGMATTIKSSQKNTRTTTSPGGKGGGRWLYVSHDPIAVPSTPSAASSNTVVDTIPGNSSSSPQQQRQQVECFSPLFKLSPHRGSSSEPTPKSLPDHPPRLAHLLFSPLILHIHCATLHHARPLLAAAINAGFRESGVQSLRILNPVEEEKGVMVAVRTNGLGFDSVVGIQRDHDGGRDEPEVVESLVTEEYLALCVDVINERFKWNDERRERFRRELRMAMDREGFSSAAQRNRHGEIRGGLSEDKDERRRRKREEGLARQRRGQTAEHDTSKCNEVADHLEDDLSILDLG
jgi:tRNA wybutosine-synthesizing protein 3